MDVRDIHKTVFGSEPYYCGDPMNVYDERNHAGVQRMDNGFVTIYYHSGFQEKYIRIQAPDSIAIQAWRILNNLKVNVDYQKVHDPEDIFHQAHGVPVYIRREYNKNDYCSEGLVLKSKSEDYGVVYHTDGETIISLRRPDSKYICVAGPASLALPWWLAIRGILGLQKWSSYPTPVMGQDEEKHFKKECRTCAFLGGTRNGLQCHRYPPSNDGRLPVVELANFCGEWRQER